MAGRSQAGSEAKMGAFAGWRAFGAGVSNGIKLLGKGVVDGLVER